MAEKICGVYKITSPSGSYYIGSSVNVLSRWSGHKADLRNGRHHSPPLQRAANKYGVDALKFEILFECERPVLRHLEQLAVDWCAPEYNASRSTFEALTELWQDPEFRERNSKRVGEQIKRLRQDPVFREKHRKASSRALSDLHKDPEFAKAHKVRATDRLMRLVNSSDAMKEKAAEGRRKRIAEDRKDPDKWAARFAKVREVQCRPVLCVETGSVYPSLKAAGEWVIGSLGYKSYSQISNALNGRNAKSYGYTWRFVDEVRSDA